MSTIEELRSQLAECQAELAASKEEYEEFVESSKELEGMLQSDLDVAEEALAKERLAREKAEQDKKAVQDRFTKETRQFADEIELLKTDLNQAKTQNSGLLTARQHLEQNVDDLERREREVEAVAEDSSAKLEEVLEEKILLQQDMEEHVSMSTEQQQRLKDEIRDLQDELCVTKRKMDTPRVPSADPTTSPVPSTQGSQPGSATSPLSTRGLVVIGDMLKRVKDMEERLAGCRSSLGQMLSSREGTPKSKRGTPRHRKEGTPVGKGTLLIPSLKL